MVAGDLLTETEYRELKFEANNVRVLWYYRTYSVVLSCVQVIVMSGCFAIVVGDNMDVTAGDVLHAVYNICT